MKRILCIAALLCLSHSAIAQTSPTTNQAPSVVVNSIAVVVNDEVITQKELQDRIHMIEQRLRAQGVALPPPAELKRQVMERMIVDRAQLQLARDTGVRVDDTMLDRTMARMAEQNKMSLQTLRDQIEKEGMSYAQFRESVREEILLQRVLEREVGSKVQVSEAEIDNFLAVQKANQQNVPEVELSHILIRIPENATPETLDQVHQRAESVLQKVKAGEDFSQLAASYSDSTEGLKGGALGWRAEDRYPQLFIDAIANLNVGEATGLIKSANGFHILKLTGKRDSNQAAQGVPQAHVRHILIKVTPTVTKEQAKHKLLGFKQRVENGQAQFDELAEQFSNDPSAVKGGDLGWIYPGDVPEFDSTINALQEGQVGGPIETPLGMHLIQVLGRKMDEISPERQRLLARQAIHERKLDEATLDWLRQLRDQAYVEIRSNQQ